MDDFKLSNEERTILIEQLLDQITNNSDCLQLVRNDDAIITQSKNGYHNGINNVHTYSLYGTDITRKTQNNNLIQKIEELQKISANSAIPQKQQIEIDDEMERHDGQLFRYFKNNIRCFRCKKLGHYNYACLDQFSCLYCLGNDHYSDKCPQKTVCYQCYHYGHIINECSAPPGTFCQDCKRKHSRVCCFLTKGIEPIKQMFNTDYLTAHELIRCMRCLEYGHLVCHPAKKHQDSAANV